MCGTNSLKEELRKNDFVITENLDEVDCIVMGFDTELTFKKLEDACILLGKGVDYIATNPDWVCPTWYGSVPDCGSISQILCNATGRMPRFIGKPQPTMVQLAMQKAGATPEQTVVIGDRMYTDIACGVNAGVSTVFVLSGEGTMEDVETGDTKPEFIYDNIAKINKQPFFAVDPYVGVEYAVGKALRLTLKADWMLAINSDGLNRPMGPRVYFGFIFAH